MILICMGAMTFFGLLYLNFKGKEKKYFIITACIILTLYAALRAHNLQPDIPVYVKYYRDYAKFSFQGIIEIFETDLKDPFYYFFGWCFSRVFGDVQWWLTFISLIYLICVSVIIYKESNNPFLSILAFISLTYFEFSLSGLRQTIAMSFTILSYFFIKKRKPFKFILLVLLASLFHRSALFFLIAYPVARSKIGKVHYFVAIVAIMLFVFGQSVIRNFLQEFLFDTQYEGYVDRTVGLSIAGFVIQFSIFIFCMVYSKDVYEKYSHSTILYNLAFIGLIFQLFSSMIAEVFRLSMYFSFFNVLLIPLAISVEKNKRTQMIETIAICIMFVVYMFVAGVPNYAFYWS